MNDLFYKAAGAILAPFRYAEREVQHLKEVAKEDLDMLVAKVIKLGLIGMVSLLFLLFLSITVAAAINEATGSAYAGFAIVTAFYLLTGVGLYIWKVVADKKRAERKEQHVVHEKRVASYSHKPAPQAHPA